MTEGHLTWLDVWVINLPIQDTCLPFPLWRNTGDCNLSGQVYSFTSVLEDTVCSFIVSISKECLRNQTSISRLLSSKFRWDVSHLQPFSWQRDKRSHILFVLKRYMRTVTHLLSVFIVIISSNIDWNLKLNYLVCNSPTVIPFLFKLRNHIQDPGIIWVGKDL